MTIELFTTYEPMTCSCGCQYALPVDFVRERRRDHKTFYCPNGCRRHYPGKSDIEKLRDEVEWQKRQRQFAEDDAAYQEKQRRTAERRATALKGVVTRTKNRVGKGTCPCCNRYFKELHRHMADQHPDYVSSEDAQ